jgi:hypothetical protein
LAALKLYSGRVAREVLLFPRNRPPHNVRHLGVHNLIASCLNPACRHDGLIDVSKYPDDIEVSSFVRSPALTLLHQASGYKADTDGTLVAEIALGQI